MFSYRILLADDDEDDRDFFKYALGELKIDLSLLSVAKNGQEVISYLNSDAGKQNPPQVIILDQNMPLLTGEQTLIALKADEDLKHIPVAIYSTSDFSNSRHKFTDSGAICVAVKPIRFEEYKDMIKGILELV